MSKVETKLGFHWRMQNVVIDDRYVATLFFDLPNNRWVCRSMEDEFTAEELRGIADQLDLLNKTVNKS